MNTKFVLLGRVLTAVRRALQQDIPRTLATGQFCAFCFDQRGNVYDIQTQPHFPRAQESTSAFILLNFNLYQNDHVITNECVDLLLRIYATKALDYQIADVMSSSERVSQTTDGQTSLDSLCDAFVWPEKAPIRADWTRDDDATHCMCCRRAAFSMLMRRHHCRRCGRVVCFACSTHRLRIPELYAEVEVRVCNDCRALSEQRQKRAQDKAAPKASSGEVRSDGAAAAVTYRWQLSGNITHDKLVREEFCYEHAPSVALCLSILGHHLGQQKCVELLLYHCRKLEKLILPNPEVDFELLAQMMNCLALAAKVRGGPADVETIREHSEIVISVVQNGCEALLPPGPLNNHNLRKLADALVQAEKWALALEVHLKCGFPTAGVMAAHGLCCLRAGLFDTAREKFVHCMPKHSNESLNQKIQKFIMSAEGFHHDANDNPAEPLRLDHDIPAVKRPQRGPPLLQELLRIIEALPSNGPQPETLRRASVIRSSNSSLASLLSRRKDTCIVPMHEPALNVMTSLANLKRITRGHYSAGGTETTRPSRHFEECLHYVLTYGSHGDVLQFLMRRQELSAALKYCILQNVDAELFVKRIFLVALRGGKVPQLIEQMAALDARLWVWRGTLIHTCRYLETQHLYNSLYQLQLLLKDPVRASMTCVKFYSMHCDTFRQLHANAQHLHNAHKHLQSELEVAQWEGLNADGGGTQKRRISVTRRRSSATSLGATFLMQMDARTLNGHINTILKQMEVAKFLAHCERESSAVEVLKQIRLDSTETALPTLFDTPQSKIQICILILYCGRNVEEGFGLAYSIIQDYKLSAMKVYGGTAKILARNHRLGEVERLLNCISSNNGINTRDVDEILSIAINAAVNGHETEVKTALDNLVKRIHSVELRISCHIFIGQLKSAYLLANKHERLNDIRRILRQAEISNQIHIKKLCEKKLHINAAQSEQL